MASIRMGIILTTAVLIAVETMIFIFLGFSRTPEKDFSISEQSLNISKVAPAALAGEWQLIK